MTQHSFTIDTETIEEAIKHKYEASGSKTSLEALQEVGKSESTIEYDSTRPEDPADLKPWLRALTADEEDDGLDLVLGNGVLHQPDYLRDEEGYRTAQTRVANLEVSEGDQRIFSPELLIFRSPEVEEYQDSQVVENIRRTHEAIEERDDLVGTPALENMPETGSRTVLETESDIDRVERLSNEEGYDMHYVLDVSYPEDLEEFAERLPADRVEEVQLSNRRTKPDGVETHLPPNVKDGDYNMAVVLDMVEDNFPDADLSVEIDPDYLDRRNIEATNDYLESHL
jgi:hypothetical protein